MLYVLCAHVCDVVRWFTLSDLISTILVFCRVGMEYIGNKMVVL